MPTTIDGVSVRAWRRCACGCRQRKSRFGGPFLQGHDQKLRAQLEAKVGGLLALRALVEAHVARMQSFEYQTPAKEVTPE
jgi:hypothetical protein